MSVKQIKAKFQKIITEHADTDPQDLRRIFTETIRTWERDRGWQEGQKGKPWTDDELRVILADAPTKDNCVKHARASKRGYGAIEQVYRWAATTDAEVRRKRPNVKFIKQIKKVSKQLGWCA